MAKKVLTQPLTEPMNGVKTAQIQIQMVDGNLEVDSRAGGELLASGMLEYLESQTVPTAQRNTSGGQTALILQSSRKGQPWIRFPWSACNGATNWQIHLTPSVSLDLTAHSGGGNIRLDCSTLRLTRLAVDTGGGNIEISLPEPAANLSVDAKTGAGNLTLRIPGGAAARIHATSGLGKVIVDPRFQKIDDKTYQSAGYERAEHKVEITAASGAGNVSIEEFILQYQPAAVQA